MLDRAAATGPHKCLYRNIPFTSHRSVSKHQPNQAGLLYGIQLLCHPRCQLSHIKPLITPRFTLCPATAGLTLHQTVISHCTLLQFIRCLPLHPTLPGIRFLRRSTSTPIPLISRIAYRPTADRSILSVQIQHSLHSFDQSVFSSRRSEEALGSH